MEVRLLLDKGSARKRSIRLKSAETVIGRRHDCDLRIRASEVSRRHCLLSIHADCLHVEDLDSVNGTFLNGQRVGGRQVVLPGARLDIGPISFRVEYELTPQAKEQLGRQGLVVAAAEEELEVLPLVEEETEAVVLEEQQEQRAAFRFVDEDRETELLRDQPAEAELPVVEAVDDGPIPVEEFEIEADWELSPGDDAGRQPRPGPIKSPPRRDRRPEKG